MTASDKRRQALSPGLIVAAPGSGEVRTVVLVLPGGRAHSTEPTRPTNLVNLRMIPFTRIAKHELRGRAVAVWRLRYRVRGWNDPVLDPVRDTEWALREVTHRHPGAQVHLIGYSMGGRTALRCAADAAVVSVCALAPWIEPGEPVAHVAGCRLLIAHGDRDRITDPRMSRAFAEEAARLGAAVRYEVISGDGHGMLRHASRWNALVREYVDVLAASPATD